MGPLVGLFKTWPVDFIGVILGRLTTVITALLSNT